MPQCSTIFPSATRKMSREVNQSRGRRDAVIEALVGSLIDKAGGDPVDDRRLGRRLEVGQSLEARGEKGDGGGFTPAPPRR